MCGLTGKMGAALCKKTLLSFFFLFTAYLETLLAKDINGLYCCRLAAASMASVAG